MLFVYFAIIVLAIKQSSSNILIPCVSNSECNEVVPTSICSAVLGGYCQCPAGFTFSTDVTKCLKEALFGEACSEAVQCSHMLAGAQCSSGFCGCSENLTYIRGRCRKLVDLNKECNDEIDCFFGYNRESVACREGKCQCADGFYQRFTNICRRESIIGDACIVNADCVEPDSTCRGYKCTSTAAVQKNSLANAIEQSLESYLINDDESTSFGDLCESENEPCDGLKYSLCRRGFCQCQEGFYERDGICKAELGEIVEDETFCGSGTYQNSLCGCANDAFYLPNMRACIKSATGINTSCTQPSQCTPYGAAFCPVEQPRRCTCHEYAVYNGETQLCEMKEGLGEFCLQTEDCKVANTICSDRSTCECKPNFASQDGEECQAAFGADCEVTDDCAFENAECKEEGVDEDENSIKKCRCTDDHIGIGNSCFEKARNYNDTCEETEQCIPELGSKASCFDNKCICDDSLHFRNGQCNFKKELGERCSKTGECFVDENLEATECRNGVCQCKFQYSENNSQNRCVHLTERNSSERSNPLQVVTLMITSFAVVITSSTLKDAFIS